jgi:hypothetical protein
MSIYDLIIYALNKRKLGIQIWRKTTADSERRPKKNLVFTNFVPNKSLIQYKMKTELDPKIKVKFSCRLATNFIFKN